MNIVRNKLYVTYCLHQTFLFCKLSKQLVEKGWSKYRFLLSFFTLYMARIQTLSLNILCWTYIWHFIPIHLTFLLFFCPFSHREMYGNEKLFTAKEKLKHHYHYRHYRHCNHSSSSPFSSSSSLSWPSVLTLLSSLFYLTGLGFSSQINDSIPVTDTDMDIDRVLFCEPDDPSS
jgi:hypothetical protein